MSNRQDGYLTLVEGEAKLDGEEVLPGFGCPSSEVLAAPAAVPARLGPYGME